MRELLAYLAIKYHGNFYDIRNAIMNKEQIPPDYKDCLKNLKSSYITIMDPQYPAILKEIMTPPIVLFYYGDINLISSSNIVGIIGARKNTKYGKEITIRLVDELIPYNPIVISGMAVGIDSIAQNQALNNNLKTIAVLGSGIDYCYPSENQNLYDRLKKEGLIISEYPNDTPPEPNNFLIRNRIIAALSSKLIVCEAKRKSGTMNTVCYALNYNKDVYCIPYPANCESGCNILIQQGASLLIHAKDIYE